MPLHTDLGALAFDSSLIPTSVMATELTAPAVANNNHMIPPAMAGVADEKVEEDPVCETGVADALVKEGHQLFRPAGETTRIDESGHVRPIMVKVDKDDCIITEDGEEDHVRQITKMESVQEEVRAREAMIVKHGGFKGNPKLVSVDFWHLEIQKVDEMEGEFTMKVCGV